MDVFTEQISRYIETSHAQRATDRISGIDARFNNVMQTVRFSPFNLTVFFNNYINEITLLSAILAVYC